MEESSKVFTLEEVSAIAESAADRAIHTLFLKLDIDAKDHQALVKFRRNLEFLNDQREGSEKLKETAKKSVLYVIGVALMGMMYISWDVVKAGVKSVFMGG
jgi:hypothetical protein